MVYLLVINFNKLQYAGCNLSQIARLFSHWARAHLVFPTLVEVAVVGLMWRVSACSSHHNPEMGEPS